MRRYYLLWDDYCCNVAWDDICVGGRLAMRVVLRLVNSDDHVLPRGAALTV